MTQAAWTPVRLPQGPVHDGDSGTAGRPDPSSGWAGLFLAFVVLGCAASLVSDFRIALTALTLGALATALLGLRHPIVGVFSMGVLCTLDSMAAPLLVHSQLWRWNMLNYLLLLVLVVYFPLLARRLDSRAILLLLLVACLGLGLLPSTDIANGVQHILGALGFFGLLVYFVRAARIPGVWYWLALVNGLTAVMVGLAFMAQQSRLPEQNPNVWSHVPVMGVLTACLAFAAAPMSRRRQRLLAAISGANASVVFLSGSRGNLAIVLVALVALAAMAPRISHGVMALITTLALSVAIVTQFPALETRTLGRLKLLSDPTASARRRTSGRFDLAVGGWAIFRRHPIGVGTGSFPTYWARLGSLRGRSNFEIGKQFSAHSAWVKVLTENGVPGIALFIGFVGSFAVSGLRRRTRRLRVLGLFVAAVMAVGFLSTEFQAKSLWYLAAGATVLLAQTSPGRRRVRAGPAAASADESRAYADANAQ